MAKSPENQAKKKPDAPIIWDLEVMKRIVVSVEAPTFKSACMKLDALFDQGEHGDSWGKAEPQFTDLNAPSVSAASKELDDLRRMLCAIGIVEKIEDHDVIRRLSMLNLVNRAITALQRPTPT